MIVEYLEKSKDLFLEKLYEAKKQLISIEAEHRENAEFIKILEENNDPSFEAFTPRTVNAPHKEKIAELELRQNELDEMTAALKMQIRDLEDELQNVDKVIDEAEKLTEDSPILEPEIRYVDRVVEKVVEKIVEVPVEPEIKYVDRIVEKVVEVPAEPKVEYVEKIVEKIVEVPAEPEIKYVDRIVEKVVEVPTEPKVEYVEKVVEKIVEVPAEPKVEYVEKIVEKIVEVPADNERKNVQEKLVPNTELLLTLLRKVRAAINIVEFDKNNCKRELHMMKELLLEELEMKDDED